jgi:site-specific recombinase XerD
VGTRRQRSPATSSPADIEQYLRETFVDGLRSPRSRSGLISALKSWYGWLLRSGLISADPTIRVAYPKINRLLPRPFSPDHLKRLFAVPAPTTPKGRRDIALMMTALAAGPRVSELIALNVEDITFTATGAALRIVDGKGGKERTVKIRNRPARWILELCIGEPPEGPVFRSAVRGRPPRRLTKGGVEHILTAIGVAAHFSKGSVHAHRFRATYATRLHEEGHAIEEISVTMGHSDINTTRGYIAVSPRTQDRTTIGDRFIRSIEPTWSDADE